MVQERRNEFLKKAACLFLPAAVFLWMFWPALFDGMMIRGVDAFNLALPFDFSARRTWLNGEWPLWEPGLLGGMPALASANLLFLHPLILGFTWLGLPITAGYGLNAFVHGCASAWGMHLFLRLTGSSRPAALFGALAFALSGTQLSILYAGHSNNVMAIAMIPWAFFGLGLALKGPRPYRGCAVLGAALALQMLSLGMQVCAYTVLALAAFAFLGPWNPLPGVRRPLGMVKATWLLGAGILLAALLSAPQLLPSLQYKAHSLRQGFSYQDFISWSFPPREALTWFIPGAFGWREPTYHGGWPFCLSSEYFGLLPWFLALGAARRRESRRFVLFFFCLALVSFLIALGRWTPLHLLFYRLPIFSGFRTWARFLCLFTFSLCVLAARGWDAWVAPWSEKQGTRVLVTVFAVMVGLHLWDLNRMHRRFIVFVNPGSYVTPPAFADELPNPQAVEPYRIEESDEAVWGPNRGMLWGYESLGGYHGLPLNAPQVLSEKMKHRVDECRKLMGVRVLLSKSGERVLVKQQDSLARAFLVSNTRSVSTVEACLDAMGDTSLSVAREAVWVGGPVLKGKLEVQGEVRWESRSTNGFQLDVHSPSPACLVVSQAWYPGWRAWVDGQETRLYQTDGALQGIRLPMGRHKVNFRFESPAFNMGRWLAGVGVGIGLLFLVL